MRVHTLEGAEAWVLVHIEIQGEEDADFAKRMYIYNYRIFDRYDRRVASLAVLTDDRPQWRPSSHAYEPWGWRTGIEFPIVKLLDYERDRQTLEKSSNPFAIVVMAQLQSLATRHDPKERLRSKLALVTADVAPPRFAARLNPAVGALGGKAVGSRISAESHESVLTSQTCSRIFIENTESPYCGIGAQHEDP